MTSTIPTAPLERPPPGADPQPTPGAGVRVLAEIVPTRDGRQALQTAAELAGARGRLTAVAIAVTDAHTPSCCGISAAVWNRLMREQAAEVCAGAERAIGAGVAVDCRVVAGRSPDRALAAAVVDEGADLLVVPAARGLLARFALRRLRRRVRCLVVEAPRTPRR